MALPHADMHELYKESFNALGIPVFILNNDGKVIYSNKEAKKVFADTLFIEEKSINYLQNNGKEERFEAQVEYGGVQYDFKYKRITNYPQYLLEIDRTEERKIKEQLIASEERFRRMFEQSSLGIYQTSPEGKIIAINESFAKMFGYASVKEMEAQIENIPQQIYVNPEDRKRLFDQLENEPDNKAILEMDFKRKDNSTFIGYLHVRKVSGPDDNSHFYEGYIEDITDRKEAELELQQSRDKLKRLVETMPYGINEVDVNGFITYNNTSLEKMLGYAHNELLGKHVANLRPDDMPVGEATKSLKKIVATHLKPERIFDQIKTKAGNVIEVQIDWDYLYDENQKVTGFINIISDITERKKAEKALKESEERFRSIYENSTLGIYRTTRQGEILLANATMHKLFGYKSPKEFKERNAKEIYLNPNERVTFIKEIIKKGYINGYEVKGKKKDGSLLYFRESARAIKDDSGKVLYFDGILEDYTEKKIMEQNLIHAKEEAEKADKLKSAFLANMSHEIRTPMNGIMGFANLLGQPDIADEIRTRYTKIIKSRGEDLLRIISDILDISKIEASQLRLYTKEFSLNDFVDQLYLIYKQRLQEYENKELEFSLNYTCRHNNYVLLGDETRIKQIITNYIDNAIKFTEKGKVEFGCIQISESEIQFYVEDTGVGIPEKMQDVVFERFRQNDESPTRVYGGNGLGLAICKGLSDLMGGKVAVQSKENVGSTFYFTFPVTFVHEFSNQKEKIDAAKYEWPKKKILLVEDDDVSAALIEEYFENTKVLIKRAGDGYSALRMIKNENYNLVLLDIGLPDISGIEVAKKIRKDLPKLPVIAQTAFAMKEDEKKCKEAGCSDYLKKPVLKEALLTMVNTYLG